MSMIGNTLLNEIVNFGNARTARNLFLEVISTQEKRLASLLDYNDEDLSKLIVEDIPK